jgi:hypothetical protein
VEVGLPSKPLLVQRRRAPLVHEKDKPQGPPELVGDVAGVPERQRLVDREAASVGLASRRLSPPSGELDLQVGDAH